ncbi:cytochrome b [Novosphingobium lentum]|uniref:cytochrome b n=1 Tax=Novosphingobium lentum TaxID=145287 RepID=UPI00083266EE|nr:cytochrome b [Novosphingobium lentum]
MINVATRNPSTRYSTGAIVFHWLIALLIAVNFGLVWTVDSVSKAAGDKLVANHKAIGILVLLLTLGRIAWRLMNRPPEPIPGRARWETLLATTVHSLFYVLMIGLPFAGWALHSLYSGGHPVSIFGLFDFPGLPFAQDKQGGEVAMNVHGLLADVLLVLAALHVAGALKHQFLDKDGEIWRMIPRRR